MAENEILDLGNSRLYARFRHLLATPDANAAQIVDGLIEDFTPSVRRVLRRAPLHTVLKACGGDRFALQEAVAGFKERAMAALVQQAHATIRSNDPAVMAEKVTELLFDRLIDRVRRRSLHHDHYADAARRSALIAEVEHRLNGCRMEVENLIVTSLRGDPIKRTRRILGPKASAGSVLGASLLGRPGSRGVPHA